MHILFLENKSPNIRLLQEMSVYIILNVQVYPSFETLIGGKELENCFDVHIFLAISINSRSFPALSILMILLDKCQTKTFKDMNILIKPIIFML